MTAGPRFLFAGLFALIEACSSIDVSGPPLRLAPAQPATKRHALLYAAYDYDLALYSYPGGAFVRQVSLRNSPDALCSDARGNVWVTTGRYNGHETQVLEFSHAGTTPIAIVNGPSNNPLGCSVDPTTGNLAVSTLGYGSSSQNPGYVLVYRDAPKYPPISYKITQDGHFFYCAYDSQGDLFVDGVRNSKDFIFYELPKGRNKFVPVTLDQSISSPGAVEWDGSHVAVADAGTNDIYQFAVVNGNGTQVGTTTLENAAPLTYQFWIQGATVVAEPDNRNQFAYWNYPAGGLPTKTFAGGVSKGFTVSN